MRHALWVIALVCTGCLTAAPDEREAMSIVRDHCAICHFSGGSGPMPLTTVSDVRRFRRAAAQQVRVGEMPPWLPAPGCQDYKGDYSLSALERDVLLDWLEAGAPASETTEREVWLPDPAPPLPRVDLTLQLPEPYRPHPTIAPYDDFRCFLIDWPLSETTYVRGIDVHPGDPRLMHHMIVFVAEPEQVETFQAYDEADPDPGWTCYGGLGEAPAGLVAGWQPGTRGGVFPGHIGRKIEPGSKLIFNMHYDILNLGTTKPGVAPQHLADDEAIPYDQTSVDFMLDEGGRLGIPVPVLDPGWLLGEFHIRAGDPAATFEYEWRPGMFTAGLPLSLHNATIHMHLLGKSARLDLIREDGEEECLLDIPRWDFLWAGVYEFERAIRLEPTDRLRVRCVFDNSAENQPILFGERLEPQDLTWDGVAPNEMCAGILLATLGF